MCARDRKTLAPLFDKMAEYAVLKLHGIPENTEDQKTCKTRKIRPGKNRLT